MKLNEPYLIIDLNDESLIFFIITCDETNELKIIKKKIIESTGIQNGKIIDYNRTSKLIKEIINQIEDEIDFYFSKVSIVINPTDIKCLNVSGFKKLNGSQVLNEDIAFILNDVKNIVTFNENKSSVIHLFNSSFNLDSDNLENLPIGLFGEFYNQNMTFILSENNVLKNFKLALEESNISINKIISKPFAEAVHLISRHKYKDNFFTFELKKNQIQVSLFRNKSFIFFENFNFGLNLIIKDISKLCSLKEEEVEILLNNLNLKEHLSFDDESVVEKNYFSISPYRKVKHKLVLDIIVARIDELLDICCKKNLNLSFIGKDINNIYFKINSEGCYKNIQFALENIKNTSVFNYSHNYPDQAYSGVSGAAELIMNGWEKEAVPVTQEKKSLISRFFSSLFT
jgi:cell division protein FtsA